ncbi:MAG: PhzF family phenazine biosynthesis protein [Terriglobales bacterium]
MPLSITQVDAFTDRAFSGNPAAVCVLPAPADAAWMQHLAREMNLSETAFLHPEGNGHRLRWFTPTVEVPLCGHATLACAHVLWESGRLASGDTAHFHTASGELRAVQTTDGIEMDFPAKRATATEPPPLLLPALGLNAAPFVGKNVMDYLVEVESEAVLRALRPNFSQLRELPVRGVIVTCRAATPEYDIVSRFFAPGSGVDEDPVTGSAHCCLGPYWQERLGSTTLRAYQASARGGAVGIRLQDDRVYLTGQAVVVMRGELEPAALLGSGL